MCFISDVSCGFLLTRIDWEGSTFEGKITMIYKLSTGFDENMDDYAYLTSYDG